MQTTVKIERDTVWNTKTNYIAGSIPKPKLVYIDTGTNKITVDTIYSLPVNQYNDSLINDDGIFNYSILTTGKLKAFDLNYSLNIPEITNTKTITIPKLYNSLYLTAGLGGNKDAFNNISIGGNYVSKYGYSSGYNYNFQLKTHNITIGKRLFAW